VSGYALVAVAGRLRARAGALGSLNAGSHGRSIEHPFDGRGVAERNSSTQLPY